MSEEDGAPRAPEPVSFVAHVGGRNQITIPKAIVDLLYIDTESYVQVVIKRVARAEEEED